MDFSHNKLKDVKITYFGKLLKVDVSYNELTQAQILGNDNQTDLDVSHNQLTRNDSLVAQETRQRQI